MAHVFRFTVAIAFITLCTVLPFLPGPYDPLAVPLSLMAQVFGKVGLLLVPAGALWLLSERWSPLTGKRYLFALIALIASSVVGAFVTLAAMTESLALGFVVIVLGVYLLTGFWRRLKPATSGAHGSAGSIPLFLIVVPVAVLLIQLAIAGPISRFSRSRAIRNSAGMIADIEQHRIANGRYPSSLMSVQKDYKPSVIGIEKYQYELNGEAYNVLFEQPSFRLGTREIVMYNPRDEQGIASHAMDVLQLTPEQLALDRTRGHYAVHDAPHPHWKYFWFD